MNWRKFSVSKPEANVCVPDLYRIYTSIPSIKCHPVYFSVTFYYDKRFISNPDWVCVFTGGVEVAGSNPVSPTSISVEKTRSFQPFDVQTCDGIQRIDPVFVPDLFGTL